MSHWPAKYPGECPSCGHEIEVGQDVMWVDYDDSTREVAHRDCLGPDVKAAPPCPRCFQVPAASGACGCDE